MTEQTIGTFPTVNDILDAELTAPLMVRSSSALGWQGVEVQRYIEPAYMEQWVEPTTPDVTLMLLTSGLVTMGECRSSCQGYTLRQGDLFLKPAATAMPPLHWQSEVSERTQMLHIRLSNALLARTIEELADRDPARCELVGLAGFQDPLLQQIGLALDRELEAPSLISPMYAQTAAYMIAVHLLRHYAIQPIAIKDRQQALSARHLKRIVDYIQAHLSQAVTLDELARQTGFSPYHFARLFRQTVGESPHRFVLRRRVEQAQHLLSATDMPLSQIAAECGFADQSHLTAVFKRHFNITPKAFRQIH
ncbi:MAG: helix-turn-helix transcriptional regulator [Anaerolineae bacterium]|nr:helix-turn-helix transcriptional regulator [Anaerolineae bacterium]